ncbi:helix-turn-helix domain-containing protein [Frateuria aurantia]
MKIDLVQASDLGALLRAVRKAQGLRQDDTAGSIGVSENFLSKVERGSESVQWGLLFKVMRDLGVQVQLDLPEIADARVRTVLKLPA